VKTVEPAATGKGPAVSVDFDVGQETQRLKGEEEKSEGRYYRAGGVLKLIRKMHRLSRGSRASGTWAKKAGRSKCSRWGGRLGPHGGGGTVRHRGSRWGWGQSPMTSDYAETITPKEKAFMWGASGSAGQLGRWDKWPGNCVGLLHQKGICPLKG